MTNWIKTILLLGGLSVLLIFIGGAIGGRDGIYMAFFFSLLMNGGAFFFSDKLALAANGAKPLAQKDAPEIYQMVRELSHKMNIPMPKLFITPAMQANAFATGRGPSNASVAVTQGILQALTKEELRAVLAHELAHVKNRDILIATIAAVMASAISFMANMAMFGGFGGNSDDDRPSFGGIGILLALLVPIGGSIIQMAISRQREFGADESGARIIGDGDPLAKALVAIHKSAAQNPMRTSPAFSSLYIGNPMGGLGGAMMKLFSTHPPLEERIERLKKI